jgi:hypothetical protein
MIRARFHCNCEDPRPVNWPIKHPYWVSGYGEDHAIIVAYADNIDEIKRNWPDSRDFSFVDEALEYVFTDRFARPEWFKEPT